MTSSVEELTESIRPAAHRAYGDYARSAHRGVFKQAMRGPKKSRADQLLKRFN